VNPLKGSKYNLIFPLDYERQYLVYNSMCGEAALIDEEMRDFLLSSSNGDIETSAKNELFAAGFLVEDKVDEMKILDCQYQTRKYHSQELWFTVMTTYACNLACPYCYQGCGQSRSESMSRKDAENIAEFIENYTINSGCNQLNVLLYGGEPLLNYAEGIKLIERLDSWAEDKGVGFGMGLITNGTLFNKEIGEDLLKFKQTVIQFTLDGPKTVHDRRRIYKDGCGTYDDIIRALELASDLGLENLFLRIDVDKDNINQISELFSDLKERGLQHIPLGFGLIEPKTSTCSSYSSLCIEDKESLQQLPRLWSLAMEDGFDVRLRPQPFFVYCGAQTNYSFIVDPKGDLYKCSNFVGQRDHCIGSIHPGGILDNYRYEYFDWMSRNPLKMKGCQSCKVLPLCGGGCAGLAYTEHGTFHMERCGTTKYLIESQIKQHLKRIFPHKFGVLNPEKVDHKNGGNKIELTSTPVRG
jgi:uncharacterized protein